MTIRTADGIEINVLPDCATCMLAHENPQNMEECPEHPAYRFGRGADECVPGECVYYKEVWL